MGKEWTRQQLQAAAEALRAVFEDVSVVELPHESEGRWQDDAMQVTYEQGGGQVSCVLRRRIPVEGGWCGIQMSAPLAGNTLPEDRMTERERELLREDLNRDFLTGAYNRRYIETVLSRQVEADMQAGRRAAVALLSLDEADRLRCDHGQPAMDQIICTIANQWKKHYDAPGSRIVCRLHGGILLIACADRTAADLAGELRRLYAVMPCDCVAGGGMMSRISFTLSMGVAGTDELPADARSWDGLYRLCDERLRTAAAAGGDCVCAGE